MRIGLTFAAIYQAPVAMHWHVCVRRNLTLLLQKPRITDCIWLAELLWPVGVFKPAAGFVREARGAYKPHFVSRRNTH